MSFLNEIKQRFVEHLRNEGVSLNEVTEVISSRPLTPEEAIGRPERDDFPLLKGKEFMIEARFRGCSGQAFTDMPRSFTATLGEILSLSTDRNDHRAILIASLNAVMRYLNRIEKTIHCRNEEPRLCAERLVEYVRTRFGNPRIAFIGLQPAMVSALAKHFRIRVTDLNPENVGQVKGGVKIEDVSATREVLEWSDVVLATGTTAVNDTLSSIVGSEKPVVFYGVTVSSIAYLAGLERFCPFGH